MTADANRIPWMAGIHTVPKALQNASIQMHYQGLHGTVHCCTIARTNVMRYLPIIMNFYYGFGFVALWLSMNTSLAAALIV